MSGQTATTFSTTTSTALLAGLKDARDAAVWREYVNRYRPLIVGHLQRVGLPAEDAEDLAQQSLVSFSTLYREGRYDRERGRLRDWLFGIVRNHVRHWRRDAGRELQPVQAANQTDFFERIADERSFEELWEQEWRDALVQQCLAQVRLEVDPRTLEAFDLFASQGVPAAEVARRLGMTPNAVFIAKHRILKRIRELLPLAEESF